MATRPSRSIAPGVISGPASWRVYPETGYAIWRAGDWFLRWDLSPLGYLATAGHGHCDALHLSVWYQGRAVFIDPGTGVYHADRPLRDYLASWDAHNGPRPVPAAFPERRGAFLWSARHETPHWALGPGEAMTGELKLPNCIVRRQISRLSQGDGWQVADTLEFNPSVTEGQAEVFWQLAPEALVQRRGASEFVVQIGDASINLNFGPGWELIERWSPGSANPKRGHWLRGACAPAFRHLTEGPFIVLRGTGRRRDGMLTTFSV